MKDRAAGTSTRLVDIYIQELFTDKEVKVIEHWNTHQSNLDLLERGCLMSIHI